MSIIALRSNPQLQLQTLIMYSRDLNRVNHGIKINSLLAIFSRLTPINPSVLTPLVLGICNLHTGPLRKWYKSADLKKLNQDKPRKIQPV